MCETQITEDSALLKDQRCFNCRLAMATWHRWAVPRYFFGTGTGIVGTFVVPVPVPPKISKAPRYRTGTLVFFYFLVRILRTYH